VNRGDGQIIADLLLDEGLAKVTTAFDMAAIGGSQYGSAQYGSSTYAPPSLLSRLERSLPRTAVSRSIEILLEVKIPSTAGAGPVKIIMNELLYRPLPNFRFQGGA
jgi:hypothetical protein